MEVTAPSEIDSVVLQYGDSSLCGDVDCSLRGSCLGDTSTTCLGAKSGVCQRAVLLENCSSEFVASVEAEFRIVGDFEEVLRNDRDRLKVAVQADIAKLLAGGDTSMVRITSLRLGSLIATFAVAEAAGKVNVLDLLNARMDSVGKFYEEATGFAGDLKVKSIQVVSSSAPTTTTTTQDNTLGDLKVSSFYNVDPDLAIKMFLLAFALTVAVLVLYCTIRRRMKRRESITYFSRVVPFAD